LTDLPRTAQFWKKQLSNKPAVKRGAKLAYQTCVLYFCGG
jgi:hypothetical protein